MDLKKLRIADYVIAGGTLLYLIFALLPWWDYGDEFFASFTLSGFDSGQVSTAFVLFLLATAWALLPAFHDLRLGFPRAWITVGLAGLGFLLTLVAWVDTFDAGFSIWALLGLLTAVAILAFSVFTLLPELRTKPALPGGLANAAQWANQPAPEVGGAGSTAQPPAPGHRQQGPSVTGTATPPTTPMTSPTQPPQQSPPPPDRSQAPPPPPYGPPGGQGQSGEGSSAGNDRPPGAA
jgi:hypothetical protein